MTARSVARKLWAMAKSKGYAQHREGDRRYVTDVKSGRTVATFQAKQVKQAKQLRDALNGK